MSTTRRILLPLVLVLVLIILYLLCWPVPISPVAWTPPVTLGLTGPYQQNSLLSPVDRLSLGHGFAPEDVRVDGDGRIYAGLDDGRIMRVRPDGTQPELFADTAGRPLGLAFDSSGNLIVADANKGLLSIDRTGAITVLATESDGVRFVCTNDLDVAADGNIYFTDASYKYPIANYRADILEHGASGRFLVFDPKTRTTRTLLRSLTFANGVAVSPDQSFVVVAETGKYRLHRFWLTGPKQGQSEIFIDNLPGFPDGISSNGKDKFWLALVTPRDQTLDKLLPKPFLRKVVYRLPRFMQPAPKRYSFVVALDSNGKVVQNLQNGSPDCYAQIANVFEHQNHLYFGSIGENTVGRFRLPQSP